MAECGKRCVNKIFRVLEIHTFFIVQLDMEKTTIALQMLCRSCKHGIHEMKN